MAIPTVGEFQSREETIHFVVRRERRSNKVTTIDTALIKINFQRAAQLIRNSRYVSKQDNIYRGRREMEIKEYVAVFTGIIGTITGVIALFLSLIHI